MTIASPSGPCPRRTASSRTSRRTDGGSGACRKYRRRSRRARSPGGTGPAYRRPAPTLAPANRAVALDRLGRLGVDAKRDLAAMAAATGSHGLLPLSALTPGPLGLRAPAASPGAGPPGRRGPTCAPAREDDERGLERARIVEAAGRDRGHVGHAARPGDHRRAAGRAKAAADPAAAVGLDLIKRGAQVSFTAFAGKAMKLEWPPPVSYWQSRHWPGHRTSARPRSRSGSRRTGSRPDRWWASIVSVAVAIRRFEQSGPTRRLAEPGLVVVAVVVADPGHRPGSSPSSRPLGARSSQL